MAKSNYSPNVKEQYEDLPYPPRDPQEEKKQLFKTDLDHFPTINHICFKGRWNYMEGARVLVAGGGTGDSTIYLAEQLRATPSEIVHIDLSKASIDVAKKRAKTRKLNNILFINGSLLDIPTMNLGEFDYINCTGVLHHLENPNNGLKALKSALKPNGCIGVMLYAKYGRTAIYQMQELMKLINKKAPLKADKIRNLKSTLASIHPNHWLNFSNKVKPTKDSQGDYGDNGLYDLYLHEQDRPYTIAEIYTLATENNLYIPDIPGTLGEQNLYLPESYVRDPDLLAQIKKLPPQEQFAIGEIMHGHIIKHTFYLTRTPNTETHLNDDDVVPTWDNGSALSARNTVVNNQLDIVPFKQIKASIAIETNHINVALFSQMDGKKALGEVYSNTIATLEEQGIKITLPELHEKTDYILTTLRQIGAFSLRHPSVPAQMFNSDLHARGF